MTVSVLAGRALNGQPFLITAGVTNNGGTLAQSNNIIDAKRVFSRDVETGNPAGFTTTYGKGYSAVPLTLTASASGTLYAALYDADSVGATSSVGTGTQLMAATPVANLSSGQQTINLNVPAGPKFYYMDLSLDSSMSNAIRMTNPFGVGMVIVATGQSIALGMFNHYAMNDYRNLDSMTTFIPQTVVYGPKVIGYAASGHAGAPYDPLPLGQDTWRMPGANPLDSSGDPAPYDSTFSAELLSKIYNKFGVTAALIGFAINGSSIEGWNTINGYGGGYYNTDQVMQHAGYKFDMFIWAQGDSSTVWTEAEYAQQLKIYFDSVVATAVKPFVFQANGSFRNIVASLFFGFPKVSKATKRTLANYSNSRFFDQPLDSIGDENHPSMPSRIFGARNHYRLLLTQKGLGSHGPTITGATRASNSAVITLTIQHDAGTALFGHVLIDNNNNGWSESSTVSSVDLGKNFYVIPAGSTPAVDYGGGDPLFTYPQGYTGLIALDAVTPVTISSPTTIQLRLAAVPTNTDAFEVYYLFNVSNAAPNVGIITDDVVDDDGINYGRILRQSDGGLYVAPPTVASAAITIATINGVSSSFTAATSCLTVITGTFAGLPPAQIDVSWDGTTYAAPHSITINNGGTYTLAVMSPSTANTYPVTVKLHGTSTISGGNSVVVSASDFPLTGVALDVDTRKLNTFFSDTNRITVVQDQQGVKGVLDSSGAGNHLVAPYLPVPFTYNVVNGLPVLANNGAQWDEVNSQTVPSYVMGLQTLQGSTLPAQLRNASYTILVVCKPLGSGTANGQHWKPVFSVETNPVTKGNPQTLAVFCDNNAVSAERRNSYNGANGTFGGPYIEHAFGDYGYANVYLHLLKILVRFDVSTGTLKMMWSGGPEQVEQMATVTGDYNTGGPAWDFCQIGFGTNTELNGNAFWGGILRTVVIPGHYASDSERDAILAYADRIYG